MCYAQFDVPRRENVPDWPDGRSDRNANTKKEKSKALTSSKFGKYCFVIFLSDEFDFFPRIFGFLKKIGEFSKFELTEY